MSRYEGYIYVTLSYNVCYFAFQLIFRDDNAVLTSLITKKTYIGQLWRLTHMLCYLQNVLNSHNIQWLKYFNKMILCYHFTEKQPTWENLFFTVPIIKMRMCGGYISLKLVSAIFYQISIFPPNDSPSKTVKMFFISSKKLFSFSTYLIFCIFPLPFHFFQIQKD